MAKPFYARLTNYYADVARILSGQTSAAAIFANSTDIGQSREHIFAAVLKAHLPSKLNTSFGGFLFHFDGRESKQIDIIITTDTTPQFNLIDDGISKTFAPVEGSIAVVSSKSTLNQDELHKACDEFASVPETLPLGQRKPPNLTMGDYSDWPYKIIFARTSIDPETLFDHLIQYYRDDKKSQIPLNRRPNIIYVPGKYCIIRELPVISLTPAVDKALEAPRREGFILLRHRVDETTLPWIINEVQKRTTESTHIIFNYDAVINQIATQLIT